MKTTDKFRELFAPYLAQVEAIASTRPDLNPAECRFTCRVGDSIGIAFAAFFDYQIDNSVGAHCCESPEEALEKLAKYVSEIKGPPTREELIAKKRAELAELEAGQ